MLATDSASNAEYAAAAAGAWAGKNPTPGENLAGSDNGGSGFAPWDFAGGYHDAAFSPYGRLNHFIDGVDFAGSVYNDLGGPAFGLTNANQAFFGYTARATRAFQSLLPGQTLSLEFDNPLLQPLDPFSAAGFLIRFNTGGGPVTDLSDVQERFGVATTSGFNGDRWFSTDADGILDTGVADAATATGAALHFTMHDSERYTAEIVRLGDQATLFSRTANLNNAGAGAIDSIEITLFGNGSGDGRGGSATASGAREFFFDNLTITDAAIGLPGDYNQDGSVDAADYTMWRDYYGSPAGTLPNDPNNAPIGDAQYLVWQSSYGSSVPAGVSTPEPTSGLLCWLAVACLGVGPRRPRVAMRRSGLPPIGAWASGFCRRRGLGIRPCLLDLS